MHTSHERGLRDFYDLY